MKPLSITPTTYDDTYITILDAKSISFENVHHLKFTEISDLAYDKKRDILYALSDHAILYTLKLKVQNNAIEKLHLMTATRLKNKKGVALKKKSADAEGMDIYQDNLLISFERKPKVKIFSIEGKHLKKLKLPKVLRDINNYQSKNKALEGVCNSKKHGYITAPELPLNSTTKQHTIYTKNRTFQIPQDGSITALECHTKEKLIIVQRDFHRLTQSQNITISELHLKTLKYTLLLKMQTQKGWDIDNIEGITHLRDNLYLLVSDDNDSIFQETQLILFEIKR